MDNELGLEEERELTLTIETDGNEVEIAAYGYEKEEKIMFFNESIKPLLEKYAFVAMGYTLDEILEDALRMYHDESLNEELSSALQYEEDAKIIDGYRNSSGKVTYAEIVLKNLYEYAPNGLEQCEFLSYFLTSSQIDERHCLLPDSEQTEEYKNSYLFLRDKVVING